MCDVAHLVGPKKAPSSSAFFFLRPGSWFLALSTALARGVCSSWFWLWCIDN
jgi:hypothetical protein